MPRVLVTDDNQAFADNLAEILGDAGHDVYVASSGEQALQAVRQERFDVMISDMRMPDIGGAELVHRARRIDPGLPAIVITAYTHDNELALARQEGLLSILPKPVPVPTLRALYSEGYIMPTLLQLLARARRNGLVALVEDDSKLCDNLTEILRERGFAAVTANTVLATSRLGSVMPFVALVDLRVPGGPDGEALRTLEARFPGIQILVMTAYHDATQALPPTDVFVKPFDTALLLHKIELIYQHSRACHG
jgi:CheY-like chemotaxis protein